MLCKFFFAFSCDSSQVKKVFFRFQSESGKNITEGLNLAFASNERGVLEDGAYQQQWLMPYLDEEKKVLLLVFISDPVYALGCSFLGEVTSCAKAL